MHNIISVNHLVDAAWNAAYGTATEALEFYPFTAYNSWIFGGNHHT